MKRLLIQVGLLQIPLMLSTVMVNAQKKKDSISTAKIDEVVITAYGVKKEKKSLGYVYQDIKGTTLVDARENNITNSLIGKVSGLEVVKSSAGPAASSKIILRGFNSLTGDNQPLIVVDGVPMVNFVGASNNDFWNPSSDMGNGLSDISPEDIENVTVLKGGAASALYGSRAGNGVILITTKTGKSQKGIGITISETVGFSSLMTTPTIQKSFGQGTAGVYPISFGSNTTGLSWGPKIEGQTVTNWNGTQGPLRAYDNISSFFQTGVTNTHSFTVSNKLGASSNLFTSASYMTDEGVVMDSKYNRLNLTSRATSKFGRDNKWSTDVKIQFTNSKANNRPVGGSNSGNYYSTVLLMPNTININDFRNDQGKGSTPYWWQSGSGSNPFWFINNVLNEDVRNRYMMNGSIKYEFNPWLNAEAKVGTDTYTTKYESRAYDGGAIKPVANTYSTGMDRFYENTFIGSINAHKDNLVGKWSGAMSVFGQISQSKLTGVSASGTLRVPNYFSVGNISNANPSSERNSESQINSVFASADINYDNFWFISGTARNDWSSTMSSDNRSYFYPSVSTSLVITDMLKNLFNKDTGKILTFAKLRASYAVTGNSLPPYQLYNLYRLGTGANGSIVGSNISGTLFNSNVTAELIKTKEFGINLRFYNRVDLDFNYYDTHATNQLINLPMNPLSGWSSMKINAGDIQNSGIEIVMNADVVRAKDFKWNMLVNWSANRNKINDIYPGVTRYSLGGYDTLSFNAVPGGYYGSIFGSSYQRVEDANSPYFGKIILDANGLPLANTTPKLLGDQTPRGLLGITQSFTYKNWGLSFQVDGRFGGEFYSGTQRALLASGLSPDTVVNGGRDSFVVDGVVASGSGYTQNTVAVTPQNYWTAVTGRGGNLGINEAFIYDATNIRLRNVQLTFSLPKKFLENTALQSAKASLAVNNVWMIKSAIKGIDPEAVYAVGTNAIGFENMNFPSLRSFLFNITLGF